MKKKSCVYLDVHERIDNPDLTYERILERTLKIIRSLPKEYKKKVYFW